MPNETVGSYEQGNGGRVREPEVEKGVTRRIVLVGMCLQVSDNCVGQTTGHHSPLVTSNKHVAVSAHSTPDNPHRTGWPNELSVRLPF